MSAPVPSGIRLPWDPSVPRHAVAVLGGAVAGSEAAAVFATRGILTVVFDQNDRPYGKIEDGLPRWHVALRKKEYERIDQNLAHAGVLFVPRTRIGRDLPFQALLDWGFSAVVLANGAWRDRPLGLPDVDRFVGSGLVYQNPLVYWFNHYPEAAYRGPRYEIPDGTIVVGGGLASIDVAKIASLELFGRALAARGIEIPMLELEHEGINAVLAHHQLTPADLGVRGCTLYYRRRKIDMPLAPMPEGASPEQAQKIGLTRARIMDKVIERFFVRFEECHMPVGALTEGDRLVGLRFRRTEITNGRVVERPGTDVDVRAPLVVSSIGSIPQAIDGIPLDGELYHFADHVRGTVHGATGVYGLGNVLTGKGNIVASRKNAREVSGHVLGDWFGVSDARADDTTARPIDVYAAASALAEQIRGDHLCTPAAIDRILGRVEGRWAEVGYDGDFPTWIQKVTPPDLH